MQTGWIDGKLHRQTSHHLTTAHISIRFCIACCNLPRPALTALPEAQRTYLLQENQHTSASS
jgi:hypothetical protein